MIQDIIIFI